MDGRMIDSGRFDRPCQPSVFASTGQAKNRAGQRLLAGLCSQAGYV